MKKIFLLTNLVFLTCLVGCTFDTFRVTGKIINTSYSFKSNGQDITYSLFIETKNERFAWHCECPQETYNYFNFIFASNNLSLHNPDEFEYITSTGEKIEFEYYEYESESYDKYEFYGPKTIYVMYNNSSDEIKEIINNKHTFITIGNFSWFCELSLIQSDNTVEESI